ncbi:MAG: GNAT family N-acetyltransferase [Treponema sp.]|nr:GNAT family N-acetyltransferase [Treponema sp.]
MFKREDLEINPVSKTNWDDFEALFEERGGPKYCWCMAWRMTKEELKDNTPERRKEYIKKRIFTGVPVGLLGYIHGEPAAWCSIAPRETYRRIGGDETKDAVWSLACFYVKRCFRRRGIADALLGAAAAYAKAGGAKYVEAYPVEEDSPSYRFMGLVKQFERAGFSYIKKEGSRRNVMTLEL